MNDLVTRAPMLADLPAVAALIAACDVAQYGVVDSEPGEVLNEWQRSRFDLNTDAWLVVAPGSRVVGYGVVYDEGTGLMHADGYVHPDYRGRGIGNHLLQCTETWAQTHAATPQVTLHNGTYGNDAAATALFTERGYQVVRYFWRMNIALDSPPPVPQLSGGLTVRAFDPATDARAVYEAVEEAFQDHWQHTTLPFEEWQQRRMGQEGFDPTLWFVAFDGATVAGAALCRTHLDGGLVSTLGVRRQWRKRGVGLALLYHAFGVFYTRGRSTIRLGVDASNPTGATRLYTRAGMHVECEYTIYGKEIAR